MNILEALKKGEENAIHVQELADMFKCDITAVKAEIRKLRREGVLICSSTKGYYIPANKADIERFYRKMRKHALTCLRSITTARKALNSLDGQMELHE